VPGPVARAFGWFPSGPSAGPGGLRRPSGPGPSGRDHRSHLVRPSDRAIGTQGHHDRDDSRRRPALWFRRLVASAGPSTQIQPGLLGPDVRLGPRSAPGVRVRWCLDRSKVGRAGLGLWASGLRSPRMFLKVRAPFLGVARACSVSCRRWNVKSYDGQAVS